MSKVDDIRIFPNLKEIAQDGTGLGLLPKKSKKKIQECEMLEDISVNTQIKPTQEKLLHKL